MEEREARRLLAAGLLAVALATLACAGGPKPDALPPQTVSGVAPDPAPPSDPPAAAPVKDDSVVVIDPGVDEDAAPRTLADAAQAERTRRTGAQAPVAVITDENLAEHATGELTFATPDPEVEANTPAEPEEAAAAGGGEEYWRGRALAARLSWREAVDRIDELEAETADLRRRFYAEDDPYYRDTQIKPAWDRALRRLEQAREAEEAAQVELEALLEEGRRAGALPGWLREGIEYEPEVAEPEPPGAEPGEPRVVGEADGR